MCTVCTVSLFIECESADFVFGSSSLKEERARQLLKISLQTSTHQRVMDGSTSAVISNGMVESTATPTGHGCGEEANVTILVSNGEAAHPRATSSSSSIHSEGAVRTTSSASSHSGRAVSHRRATSSASVHSEGAASSFHPSSSSSSSFANSSFNSRELLQQLVVDLSSASLDGESMEKNEVVKQLLEHIVTLKLELEELREENEKLNTTKSNMDSEMHTLTENLFEEAYKMVDTAKEEKGLAVKKLADAAGKIDAMETEMSALKNVLHATPTSALKVKPTSTPSPHSKHRKPNVKKAIRKLSKKVKAYSRPSADSAAPHVLLEHKNEVKGACLGEGQVDPNDLLCFKDWLHDVSREDHPYLLNIMICDVRPCLHFSNKHLSEQVLIAVQNNELLMESLSADQEKRTCVLSGCEEITCTHRMQLAPSQHWQYISQHCRDRIAAVCDFYMYMSHIQKGILKSEASQLFWQVNRLRAQMSLARLTLQLPS